MIRKSARLFAVLATLGIHSPAHGARARPYLVRDINPDTVIEPTFLTDVDGTVR
jgi:hypothetical protein